MAIYNQTNVDDATRDQNGESQFDHNQNVPCPVYKWLRGHNSLSHQRQGGGGGGVHDRLESFFIRKKDYNSNGTIFHSFFLFVYFVLLLSLGTIQEHTKKSNQTKYRLQKSKSYQISRK